MNYSATFEIFIPNRQHNITLIAGGNTAGNRVQTRCEPAKTEGCSFSSLENRVQKIYENEKFHEC